MCNIYGNGAIEDHNHHSGFTQLQTTLDEACIGESVTLSCATSRYYVRWQVVRNDRTAPPVTRIFQSSDTIGKIYSISTSELQLYFELLSNTMGVLNSTLTIHTTAALAHATIECEGTTTRRYVLKIAGTLLAILLCRL